LTGIEEETMRRRTLVLVAAVLAVLVGLLLSGLPAGASPTRDVDPTTIDPHQLALAQSSLPAGAVIDHSLVSDNADADTSLTHTVHHQLYEAFHRITGYRMDYHYTVSGVTVQAGYLASIFPTNADAMAALDDATGPGSLIVSLVNLGLGERLPDPCTAGDVCRGFAGPNPNDGTQSALIADFVRGPILVEAGAQVPTTAFTQLKTQMEAQVYGVATTVDAQVKVVLSQGSSPSSPTATSAATPTSTPTPTATPKPATGKKCKKGYKLVKGACKKVAKPHYATFHARIVNDSKSVGGVAPPTKTREVGPTTPESSTIPRAWGAPPPRPSPCMSARRSSSPTDPTRLTPSPPTAGSSIRETSRAAQAGRLRPKRRAASNSIAATIPSCTASSSSRRSR
jgi:hypothetical protein